MKSLSPLRIALATVNLLMVAAVAIAVGIALSGGGTFQFYGHTVGLHSVRNLLIVIAALVLLRFATRRRLPWLLGSRLMAIDVDASSRAVVAVDGAVTRMTPRQALTWTVCLAAVTTFIKLTNAFVHPGFFGGDDVEIHEMTLGHLLHRDWPIWDLRSAFYPMVFIYPAQVFAWVLGWADVGSLVFAGRAVVAVLSGLGLLIFYRFSTRLASQPVAVYAVGILATSGLWIEFGGMELPRILASSLVFSAYFLATTSARSGSAIAAALCLAVAACMRFSEILFFGPFAIGLMLENRRRDLVTACLVGAAAVLVIQGVSDWLYWGTPFSSAKAVIRFTLVERQSSRGFEPPWAYFTGITAWLDLLTAGLAVVGLLRAPRSLVRWVGTSLLLLSLFPHKEPRYMLPTLPLLCLLAAHGLDEMVGRVRRREGTPHPAVFASFVLILAVGLKLTASVSSAHVERSDAAVVMAKQLNEIGVGRFAVEHLYRLGGHLYLDRSDVYELTDADVADADALERAIRAHGADGVAISEASCRPIRCGDVLSRAGLRLREAVVDTDAGYDVFVKAPEVR